MELSEEASRHLCFYRKTRAAVRCSIEIKYWVANCKLETICEVDFASATEHRSHGFDISLLWHRRGLPKREINILRRARSADAKFHRVTTLQQPGRWFILEKPAQQPVEGGLPTKSLDFAAFLAHQCHEPIFKSTTKCRWSLVTIH
jgi:hypothetical protein